MVRQQLGAVGEPVGQRRRGPDAAQLLAPGSPALADALARLGAAGIGEPGALAQINRLIDQQAFTRAADDIFLASAGLFIVLIGLVWLTQRPPRAPALAGGHAVDAGGAH